VLLRFFERQGTLLICNARGLVHSPACHEFRITDHGIEMLGVYDGDRCGLPSNASASPHERGLMHEEQTDGERLCGANEW
jgi:hypothetical protein